MAATAMRRGARVETVMVMQKGTSVEKLMMTMNRGLDRSQSSITVSLNLACTILILIFVLTMILHACQKPWS